VATAFLQRRFRFLGGPQVLDGDITSTWLVNTSASLGTYLRCSVRIWAHRDLPVVDSKCGGLELFPL